LEDSERQYIQSASGNAEVRTFSQLTVIILAAGESKRMGKPKASLMVNSRESFLSYLVKGYLQIPDNNIVVIHSSVVEPVDYGSRVHWLQNNDPQKGRYYSIWLAAKICSPGSACLIHNVDQPFIDSRIVKEMIMLLTPDSYVVPTYGGKGGHPVFLGSEIINFIVGHPENLDFREVLSGFRRKEVKWDDSRILLNINTKEDYLHFLVHHCQGSKSDII
jgi:CTP:molybdopterin cytidylyltransferase MocA